MWPIAAHGSVSGMTTSVTTRRQPAPDRRSAGHIASAGVPLLALTCLLCAGVPAASAAPASPDSSGCSATLARAAVWPGTFADRTGVHRVHSDGFDSYLAAQPPCAVRQ
jgi:hypothetical protein